MASMANCSVITVLVMFSILVKGFQRFDPSSLNGWDLNNTGNFFVPTTDDLQDNMERKLHTAKFPGYNEFNQQHLFGRILKKRGNRAALIDMVDYVTVPESGTGNSDSAGIKPKESLDSRAWKTMLYGRK